MPAGLRPLGDSHKVVADHDTQNIVEGVKGFGKRNAFGFFFIGEIDRTRLHQRPAYVKFKRVRVRSDLRRDIDVHCFSSGNVSHVRQVPATKRGGQAAAAG